MRAAKRGRLQLCDHLASYLATATATQTTVGTVHGKTVTCTRWQSWRYTLTATSELCSCSKP